MVAGLQHDASHIKMKLLELERAVSVRDYGCSRSLLSFWFLQNHGLRNILKTRHGHYLGGQDDTHETGLCVRHDPLGPTTSS